MVSFVTENYLLVLLAVVFLLNPLYLFPEGVTATHTYEVEELSEEDYVQALFDAPNVLSCIDERPCQFEREVLDDGPITEQSRQRGTAPVQQPVAMYDIVVFDGTGEAAIYRPSTTVDGDSISYDLEPIDAETAVAEASVTTDSDSVSEPAKTAVEDGKYTSMGAVPELRDRAIIEHDGKYYQARTSSFSSTPEPLLVPFAGRIGFTLAGVSLLGISYWRFRNRDPTSSSS